MIKAIIVDDERSVRYAIREQGNWQKLGIDVIDEATNGLEAIAKAILIKPDLVITDMKMPGMDGPTLMRELKKKLDNVKFIVISGYDDYEYMKSAIYSQVIDYILKPIDDVQLNEALMRAVSELDAEKSKKETTRWNSIELSNAKRLTRDKLLNNLVCSDNYILGKLNKELIQDLVDLEGKARFITVVFNIINMPRILEEKFDRDVDILVFGIINIMEEILLRYKKVVFKNTMTMTGFCTVIALEDFKVNTDTESVKLICEDIIENLKVYMGLQCIIGIGESKAILGDLYKSYTEACKSLMNLNLFENNRIGIFSDISEISNNDLPVFLLHEKEFSAAIESGDDTQLKNTIAKILEQIRKRKESTIEQMKILYTDMLLCAWKVVKKMGGNIKVNSIDPGNTDAFVNFLFENGFDIPQITFYLHNILSIQMNSVKIVKRMNSRKLLYSIKDYIDSYYYEDISLGKIANKYFINSSYLCRIFKEEFNSNLTDYLIEIRLNKARELIQDGKMKIVDIMRLTGFNNLNYFGKVFKKRFGVTASEFKEIKEIK